MIEYIHWLGHESFRLDGSTTVYDAVRFAALCGTPETLLPREGD